MIDGLITDELATFLADLGATVNPPNVIVEIGSYKGKSTCALASRTAAVVVAIDPWDTWGNESGRFGFAEPSTREAFIENTEPFSNIVWAQGFSVEVARAWPGDRIGLLYIDGDHSEQAVRSDYNAWRPHMANGGTIVFDDYVSETGRSPGVERAVKAIGEPFRVELDRVAVMRV